MRTGFENFTEEEKQKFLKYVEDGRKYFGGYEPEFKAYYKLSPSELAKEKKNVYSYSFYREIGVDFAALNLLAKGYSIDTVFMAENTPELVKLKSDSGYEIRHLLDVEGPSIASDATIHQDMFGETTLDEFDPGEYHVHRELTKKFFTVLPSLKKELEELTAKIDLENPYAFDSPEGKKFLRLSQFCFDICQDLTKPNFHKPLIEEVIAEQNAKLAPGEKKLTFDDFYNFITFSSMASTKQDYDLRVAQAMRHEEISSDDVQEISARAVVFLNFYGLYKKNKDKPGADGFSLVPNLEAKIHIAEQTRDFNYTTEYAFPEIQKEYGNKGIFNSFTSGKFIRDMSGNGAGAGSEGSILGYKYDFEKNRVFTADAEMSDTQRRFAQLSELNAFQKEQDVYNLAADVQFKNLTGISKSEFLKNTNSLEYSLGRMSASSIIICDLLKKGLTMEEIMDPNAKKEDKAETVATLKAKIEKRGYEEGSAEYKKQQAELDDFALKAYKGAYPTLRAAVKRATENKEYFEKPYLIHTTKQGRIDAQLLSIAFDLNQEFDNAHANAAAEKLEEGFSKKIHNLGAACARFYAYYEVDKAAKVALNADTTAEAIGMAIKAKMNDMVYADITKGDAKYDYENFSHKDPRLEQGARLQSYASVFYQDYLQSKIELRYSREEIAAKLADGSLLKSMQIEVKNGNIQSMTILGVKCEKGRKPSTPDGKELDNKKEHEVCKRYIEEIKKLTNELKNTEMVTGLQWKNTESFNAVKNTLYKLDKDCDNASISFQNIRNQLIGVSNAAGDYKSTHQGDKLSDRQKKRLAIMKQLIKLSENATFYEKHPTSPEAKSDACNVLKEACFQLIDNNLPETPDGMDLLNERAKASYKNIYDLLASGREFTPDESKSMLQDLKTVTLHRFVVKEREQLGDKGLIANTVKNNASQLKQLINMMSIDGLEKIAALKNPTRANVEKMFGENQIDDVINKTVSEIREKVNAERREKYLAKKAAEKQNEQANKQEAKPEMR